MGNILRRVTAFLLGIVFTVTALVGGVVGGAYYAYKNVSPIEAVLPEDPGLGDLYGASIEQLLDLVTNAMDPEKNGEYTFERLAEEYGLDLEKLLTTMGIDVSEVDKESSDWKALEGISILSALSDPSALLDSVKLKALYVLAPAFLHGPIDNYLSPEAQSALGDYTLSELMSADEATGELGIVKAIKGLKIGSFLPEIFDSTFDVKTHEYVYTVKQDGALKDLTFLNLLAEVPLQGIFNIAEGKDVMEELMEGELKSITHTPIKDILNMFADVAGDEVAKTIAQYTQVFGDTSVADMFVKNDAGKYEFAYENLLSGLELGYLAGYTKDANGEWVDKEGKTASGLLGFVAGVSIGDILDNKGDVVGMINAAAGDLSLMTIYETIFDPDENGRYPLIIERLGTIKVSDILGDGKDAIVDNLKLSLKAALEGTTLRDAVYSFVDESVQEKLESIAIVDKLLDIKLDEFVRDEYTAQDIIGIFNDAIGDMTIGEVAGVEPSDDALGLLMDYRIGNILDGVIAILDGDKSPTEIVDSFIGQYRVGDIFGAFTGFTYDETQNNWGKDGKFVAKGLIPLMNMPISRFVAIFDKEYDFDIMSVVGDIQIADVAYTVLLVCGIEDILVETDLGDRISYLLGGDLADFGPLSKVILTLTVNDFVNNASDVDFWLDRLGQISLGDLSAYLINNVLPLEIKVAYGEGKWFVNSEYMQQLITNVLNTTVGGIIDAFKTGDPEVIKQKIINKVGDTNVGEIVHAALGLSGMKDVVLKGATDQEYVMSPDYSDFNHLAQALFGLSVKDIVDNYSNVDWWFEKLGGIRIGDPFVYFINKYAPEMSVSEEENGDWTVTGTMGAVLTGLFNITVGELRNPDAVQLLKDTFGDIRVGDVLESFLPEEVVKNGFVAAICNVTVNDIINMVQSETMGDLVYALQEVFEGVTIGTVTELFGLEGYDYGLFGRILGTEFEFLLGLLITPDVKGEIMYEYGDISLGEVVYTALKAAGIENILGTKTVDGKEVYVTIGDFEDFAPLSEKLLSVTVEEVLNNLNGEYWIDRLGKITIGDLSAYLVNNLLPLGVKLTHDGSKWTVDGEYLTDLLGNVFNTSIGGIINAFTSGDPELIKQKIANKLGDTNVGDIFYAALGTAGVTDVLYTSNSECGYELPAQYEELNALAQAVMGLKLADLVTKYNDGQYWLDSFGNVTVGNCIDILLPDEIETNAFLEATRGISVNQIAGMVKAEAVADVIIELQEVYDGVMISNILELAGITEIPNQALANLADTEIEFLLGLVISGDILGELAYEFNDVTLKAAVGDILANYINVENPFISATLSFGVADIATMIGAETADEVLNVIYNKYAGVMLGDVVKAIYADDIPNNAVNTIYGVMINDLVKAIAEKRIIEFLYEKFGDVRIGDIVFTTDQTFGVLGFSISYDGTSWSATSDDGNLNELFTNILNLKLSTIYNNVAATDNLKNDLLALVGETTIGEAGKLAYNNELGIGVLDKLYALKLSDIITNAFDGTILDYLKEFAFNISLDDVVGFLLTEELRTNKFIASTLAINANTVIDIIGLEFPGPMLNEIAYIYDGVNFSDIFALFGLTEAPLNVLEPIFNAGLDDLIMAIGDQTIVDYVMGVFGPISINDIVTDVETVTGTEIIPADLRSNNFLTAVLGIDVQMVYDLATGANVLETLGNKFTGATIGNVIELFTAIPEIDYVQTICTIDIGETLLGIYNNDNTVLMDKLKTAFDQLPQEVKYGIYAGVAVAGVILYFADNPLLCQIVDGVLGADATWGDVLADSLGYETFATYAVDSSSYYKNTIGYNSLMDTFFKEDVTDTLTTGYPFLTNFKNYITIANILTAYSTLTDTITNAIGMEIIQTEKGFALGNEFKDFSDNLFNLSLGEFLTEDNKLKDVHAINGLLYNTFEKNKVGDLIAYFVNLINTLETNAVKENGKWTVTGEFFPTVLEGGMNVTLGGIYRSLKDGSYIDKVVKLIGELSVGEVLYTILKVAGVEGVIELSDAECGYTLSEKYIEFNKPAQIIFGITVNDVVENKNNGQYWLDLVGEVALSDFVNYFLTEEVEQNAFVKAATSISVNDVMGMAKAETAADVVYELQEIFDGTKVNDIVKLFYKEEIKNGALQKLADTDIVFLLGLITSPDVVGELLYEYGDVTIGDIINQFIADYVDVNNPFMAATLSIGVQTVYDMATAQSTEAMLDVIYGVYNGVILGDVTDLFVALPDTKLLNVVYDTVLVDLVKAIVNGTIVDFVKTTFAETTLGDVAHMVTAIIGSDAIEQTTDGYALSAQLAELENFANTVFAINVIELVDNFTNADWWIETFKTTTLGDLVDIVIPDEIQENNFVKAVRGISVQNVINLVKAEDTKTTIAELQTIFTEEVLISDVLGLASIGDFGNKALAKLLDTDLSFLLGLVVSEDVLSAIRAEFNDITLGDALKDYITVENAFLDATYTFGVEHVFLMMAAKTPQEALKVVRDIYAAVTFGDVLNLAGQFEIENAALNKLLDTTIGAAIDVAISEDIVTAIGNEFGDITVGDAIETVLAQYIDTTNKFVSATLGIGVGTVVSLIKATTTQEILDVFTGVYEGVKLGDMVSIFYAEAAPTETVETIFDVEINALVTAITNNDLFNFLYNTFGDEAIGDIVFSSRNAYALLGYTITYDTAWKATSESGNLDTLLTNILNLRLGTIYNDVASQETLKDDLITLVGDTTLGEIGTMVYANEEGIGAVEKLYNIEFADIIESAFNGTILYFFRDFAFGITIHDLVGFVLEDTLKDNAFVKSTLSICAKTIIDMANAGSNQAVLNEVADLYNGVIFANIIELFGVTESPLSVLEPVFNAGVDTLIRAIADGVVADYVMDVVGGISVNNVITDVETLTGTQVIPEALVDNNFVKAVLAIDVQTVYDVVTAENKLATAGEAFVGATVGDVVEMFTAIPEIEALQTVCTIDIGETMIGIANNDTEALVETLKTAFNQLPEEVKYGVYAGVAAAALILYFADNPLLCKIVDGIFGEEATWGDVLADTLGYALDGTNYINEIGYNSLMDKFLKEDVTDTLTTGYPLLNNFKALVTVGNIVTAYSPIANAITNATGMNFIQTEKGFAFGNEFKDFTDNLFNLSLDSFLTEENGLKDIHAINSVLYETFNMNNVGDVTAYFVNLYAIAGTAAVKENGKWTVTGDVLPKVIANAMNVTFGGIYRGLKAEDKTPYVEKAIALFGDTNLGDIIYSLLKSSGVSGIMEQSDAECGYSLTSNYADFNRPAQILFGITLVDIAKNATNLEYWMNLVGEITVSDFVNYFLPDEIEENKFMAATTAISVNNVITMAKAQARTDVIDELQKIYEGVTLNDLIDLLYKGEITNNALTKIAETELSFLIGLAVSGDMKGDLLGQYGTLSLNDAIGQYLGETIANNPLVEATLSFDVNTIVDILEAEGKDAKLEIVKAKYAEITVGQILDKESDNTFLAETYAISVQDLFDVIEAEGFKAKVDVIASNYPESTINDVALLTGNDLSGNRGMDKVLDTKLQRVLEIATSGDITNQLIKEFGDITIGDAFGPELTPENAFLKATYDINLETIANLALDFSTNNLLVALANAYEGVTLNDVISTAVSVETSSEWFNKALTMDIGSMFNDVATGDYTYLKGFAKSVYEATTDGEKMVITVTACAAGTALYFINNELLCKILGTVFGEDATFAKFATMFGYTAENGEYTLNGLHNELMSTLFNEKMTTVLADGYPMAATFKPLLTIGNVLTMHSSILNLIQKTGLTVEEAEDGGLRLRGYLANISESVFSLSLGDFTDENNKFLTGSALNSMLYEKFHANKLGDVLRILINNQNIVNTEAFYDSVDGEWVVTGTAAGVTGRLLNVDFGEVYNMLKTKNYSVIGRVLGDVTLLDVASFVNSGIAQNATAQVVLSLKVKDVINCLRGKVTLGSLIGDWTLMEIAGNYLPDMIDKDAAFTKAFLGMTLREVYGLRTDTKNKLMAKFGEFTFAEALGFVGYEVGSSTDEIVKAVLELKLNIFQGGVDAGLDTIINTVKGKQTGVLLGYEEIDGKWYHNGTEVTGILATIASKTVNELSDPTFLNNLTIGEALGYTKDESTNKWLDNNGDELTGVLAAFADTKINDFSEAEIKNRIESLKLGEVIKMEDGTHKILKSLKDVEIGNLSEEINKLTLDQVIDITTTSPKVLQTLAKTSIKELPARFDTLTIGEVVEVSGNNILTALKDAKITDMSTEINAMKLGTIMGYTKNAEGKWLDGTEAVEGLSLRLADYTVAEVGGGEFVGKFKNELLVGDIFADAGDPTASALIRFLDPTWKVVDLATELPNKFKTDLDVKLAIELGVFGTFFDYESPATESENHVKMDLLFQKQYDNDTSTSKPATVREYWENMKVGDFMSGILTAATSTVVPSNP